MHIGFFAYFHGIYISLSNAVISVKSPHYFHALVALKLLVSLISHLVACSARIVGDSGSVSPKGGKGGAPPPFTKPIITKGIRSTDQVSSESVSAHM